MLRSISAAAAVLPLLSAACAGPPSAPDPEAAAAEAQRLAAVFEEFFEESLERNPIQATQIGDPRYNDRLSNFLSAEYRAEGQAFDRRWIERVSGFDRDLLSGQDRLSYDVFLYNRELSLAGDRFPSWMIPINQFFSLPSFFAQLGSGDSIQPFATEKDYRDFLSRIDGIVTVLDQAIANMREGVEAGVVQPRVLMEKVLPQLEAHLVDDPEESVFWRPVASFPEEVPETVRPELEAAYRAAITDKLVPVYRRLRDYIRDDYLPATRETFALTALPDGDAWYAYMIRAMTSIEADPEEVHRFGLSEVERITGEMEGVMAAVGFEGTLHDFFTHLETSDEFYFDDPEELLDGYRALRDEIDAKLPKLFDIFPKAGYEIREVPEFMAQSSAGASYQAPTPDGSRPGVFWVNTYNLRAQPRFGMETLSIHEASPGHHFQISIAQEIEELPRFRRFGGVSAYFEGWALYAESLGKELGMFTDPYQWYGRLSDEMLRAMRLVVDTGIHHRGWSRQQAIDYMMEHSSLAETDVVAEVERYIAFPAQALGYKLGQRVIADLRAEAEAELGDAFDLRAFHRAILEDGALPLPVLERKIREWLADRAG
ncbi:MAG: DUF885 domain-containing protein [Thermoanaerobaculia bacterium]|nr:DUF885 domain-containing protein [Thermoanaerobaculia bacterium]